MKYFLYDNQTYSFWCLEYKKRYIPFNTTKDRDNSRSFCIYTENLNLLYRITGFLSIKNIFVIRFCKTAFCGYIQLSADKDAYRQKEGHSEMTYSRKRKTEKYLYPSAKKIWYSTKTPYPNLFSIIKAINFSFIVILLFPVTTVISQTTS